MIADLFEKGDTVVINIPKENREWGYRPCPDGTVGTVVGFGEIEYGLVDNFGLEPGVYANKCWVDVKLSNEEQIHIGSFCLTLGNAKLAEARREAWFSQGEDRFLNKERLRDLPETKFYPADIVQYTRYLDRYPEMAIVRINYGYIGQKRTDGSDMPPYEVSDKFRGGWWTSADEDQLTLLRRGNVWKYYHKEPMTFASLEEEVELAFALGLTDDVRNPAEPELPYKWSKDQVLAAIENGLAHGFQLSGNMFGGAPIERAIRFRNEELGKRVAVATLKEFSRL
jgi:hypothetical protein